MSAAATGRDWRRRLVVGITGASGAIYGVRLLKACRELGLESHLCMSKAAERTLTAAQGRVSLGVTSTPVFVTAP